MNVELGSRLRQAGRSFVEGIRDIERGHTLQDEARARRITLYPNTVSVSDIENYKKSELDFVFLVARTAHSFPRSALQLLLDHMSAVENYRKERERQRNLTPEQLIAEVIADAQKKAEQWNL